MLKINQILVGTVTMAFKRNCNLLPRKIKKISPTALKASPNETVKHFYRTRF